MLTSEFDYDLPAERIAQQPLAERSSSRLLVARLHREGRAAHGMTSSDVLGASSSCEIMDSHVSALSHVLPLFFAKASGQSPSPCEPPLILINNSKVYPARVPVRRMRIAEDGAISWVVGEVFLLGLDELRGRRPGEIFEALLRPQKRMRLGDHLCAASDLSAAPRPLFEVVGLGEETCRVRALVPALEIVELFGEVPLPPYLRRRPETSSQGVHGNTIVEQSLGTLAKTDEDLGNESLRRGLDSHRYQTVFASRLGSAAAPTAGLHLSSELMRQLEETHIARFAPVTLHIGLGTFRPVQSDCIADHTMHSEAYSVPESTVLSVTHALQKQTPILFLGTTTFRAMESFCLDAVRLIHGENALRQGSKRRGQDVQRFCLDAAMTKALLDAAGKVQHTSLFVHPSPDWEPNECYAPMIGDGIMTNFHQPRSTLLMLVSALVGMNTVRTIYSHALNNDYRFLSYGDASLLHFGARARITAFGEGLR